MDQKQISEQLLSALQARGAQKAQCVVVQGETDEFNIDGGQFSLLRTLYHTGVSLVAIKDQRRGAVRINQTDKASLLQAVEDCIAAAESGTSDEAWDIAPQGEAQTFGQLQEFDREHFFARMDELLKNIQHDYPLIMLEQVVAEFTASESLFANTNGARYVEKNAQYSISLMFSANDGKQTSSFAGAELVCADLSTPFLQQGALRQTLEDVSKQLYPVALEGKFVGTMVLMPNSVMDFLVPLLANFAGERALLDGTSPWKDCLHTQIADARLCISAAPHDARIVGGESVTDDGFVSQDMDIVRDGVLENFLLGQYAATKTGKPRAANSSMNLVIAPGDTPWAELLAGIEHGLLVGRFSGGDPAGNGDFSGVAKNSFLIEQGRITQSVRETMVSGNLAEMLQHLRGISAEVVCDGSTVLPYLAFDGITISGK